MDKKLILAVAGSGKTYSLARAIESEARNLIIAYTRQNMNNIRYELLSRFGTFPENTKVCTFHSFIFNDFIRPNHQRIFKHYGIEVARCDGLTMRDPPKPRPGGKFNPAYKKDAELRHYIPHNQYYCSLMSKLIIKGAPYVLERGVSRLNRFYDHMLIDEFQDFRNHDYDLLTQIIKGVSQITLVGDYYQHSVSGKNNTGRPFGTAKKSVSYADYKKTIRKLGVEIDETSLNNSRRCSKNVCDFVKGKLGIEIQAFDEHPGMVKLVKDEGEAKKILFDDDVIKLVYEDATKYKVNSINWSYSKGDTYPAICVILTEKTHAISKNNFDRSKLSPVTLNKLYVALTRSSSDVFLIEDKLFKKLKPLILINPS